MILSDFSEFFFFHEPPPTGIYTLSLHDALPIFRRGQPGRAHLQQARHETRDERTYQVVDAGLVARLDRKSTRLNSSHSSISYAVFCLKKKNWSVIFVNIWRRVPFVAITSLAGLQ